MSGRGWLALLAAATLLRLGLAAYIPIAPDEAYYRVWAHSLQGGYLDHPPMVALFIRAGILVFGDTALGIRLLGPFGTALGSLMLWRTAERLFPGRGAGIPAALMLNATLLVGVGAVVMTPDTPLLLFWCAALWALAELRASGDGRCWFAVGAAAGAALLSKYTGALIGCGILLWLLLDPAARRWWRDWRLYAGGALALALFAPVVAWNAAHGWASFAKQGGRAGTESAGAGLRFIGELIGGQLALATPILFVLFAVGVALAVRRWRDGAALLLAVLVVPGAAIFLWQATGSRVQGNWPAILYPAAAIAAAALLAPSWWRWRRAGVALGLVLGVVVQLQALAGVLPLPRRYDPTLARLAGWDDFAAEIAAAARREGAGFVAAEEYGLASELALRLEPPTGPAVLAMDARWAFFRLAPPPDGRHGLLVRSLRRGEGPPLWPGAVATGTVLIRARHGIEAERYRLYRVETGPGLPPVRQLPQP
ncbi:glycosyltransferase family 39 protein [Plastoroseomonas hellenica]|uniref:glycosyltransferase family 39 protein n=1 Tax=Plastoroseomonas hellenica TaxID=2687306 RepID=UPI001BAE2F3D|nr:glycosyltransferase family 39 protein [Plastoroseomonas hellenica]MBR0646869.1 glycosyltransferase family 39 protein [Plastoroseomonas hellenica]